MEKSKPIGGYLELEISSGTSFMHSNGIMLASGRVAEEVILQSLKPISRLWIPFFTCQVILEPINKLRIPYEFYHINPNLEIAQDIILGKDEYLLYTNYFGIKDEYVNALALKLGKHLIVDNAQALYALPIKYSNAIYSPRKFVGIPDGGIAYSTKTIDIEQVNMDVSYDRCSHLLKRLDCDPSFGYKDFKENSRKLSQLPVLQMSKLTRILLMSPDYSSIKKKRRANFEYLHKNLESINQFKVPPITSFSCPLVYPFLPLWNGLKQYLIKNQVFVATYWPNVLEWCKKGETEYEMAKDMVYLPIDQRYDQTDMKRIIHLIELWKSQFDH